MSNFFTFISHSSIFISICALSLSFFYSLTFEIETNLYRYIVIFCGTLASYIGVQLIPMHKNKASSIRSLWIKNNKIILYSLLLASIFAIVASIRHLESFDLLNFTHLFIIVLFYEKIFLNEKELRKIPYIKPFLISYVWACVCTAPQIILSLKNPNYIIWAESFMFILGLTIPFDIRDIEADHIDGIKTFATRFKVKTVKVLSFGIFLIALIMQFNYLEPTLTNIIITIMIGICYLLVLSRVWPNQKEHIFLYGLDGIILLKILYLF